MRLFRLYVSKRESIAPTEKSNIITNQSQVYAAQRYDFLTEKAIGMLLGNGGGRLFGEMQPVIGPVRVVAVVRTFAVRLSI